MNYIRYKHQRYRIFFSLEKIVSTHSLKSEKIYIFFFRRLYFFFFGIDFLSFSQKMSKLVQIPKSTQNSGAGKKNTARKKKYTIFTHSLDFERK